MTAYDRAARIGGKLRLRCRHCRLIGREPQQFCRRSVYAPAELVNEWRRLAVRYAGSPEALRFTRLADSLALAAAPTGVRTICLKVSGAAPP